MTSILRGALATLPSPSGRGKRNDCADELSTADLCMNPAIDLAYRVVAITLAIYCGRKAWCGFVEGKIKFISSDLLDWSEWSSQIFHRETEPIRYWMQMSGTIVSSALCIVAATIGWQS